MGVHEHGEHTSWLLVTALCIFLATGVAVADDDDQMQGEDPEAGQSGIMPLAWQQAFQQANGFHVGPAAMQQRRNEEERQFSGDTNPQYRNSFTKTGSFAGGGASASAKGRRGPPASEVCEGTPRTPQNSLLRCTTFSGCQATCKVHYRFPNGERRISIACRDNEWKVLGSDWTTIPDCRPSCLPECQNNGICVGPNQCNCPDTFSGPQCQFESKPCLNFPPTPMNSRRACTAMSCTVQCSPGHKFPDGTGAANMICENGVWTPTKFEWAAIPDCEPECNPPCQNGGLCLSFNKCQCPVDFRGPQCQYSADSCHMRKLEFNGGRNCSGNSEIFSCSITCPPGIEFSFPPASVYTCSYSTGTFVPAPVPQCVFGENVIVRPFQTGYSFSQFNSNTSTNRVIKGGHASRGFMNIGMSREDFINIAKNHRLIALKSPGSCSSWSGSHYKSFDGKVFSVQTKCSYTLVRDKVDNTFTVNVETDPRCEDDSYCGKRLKIFVENKEFTLGLNSENNPELRDQTGKVITIPGQISELTAQKVQYFVVIRITGVGVTLKWDTQDFIAVDVSEALWNKTGGLCGRIDGHISNDFELKDGTREQLVLPFVNSWEVDSLEDRCRTPAIDEHPCGDTSSAEVSLATQASEFCNKILTDVRFEPCRAEDKKLDVQSYYESCRWDYCAAKNENAAKRACKSVATFVQECLKKGVTLPTSWRDETFCPMTCSRGKVYKQCGPASQPTCRTAAVSEQKADFCIEGCFCPEGLLLNNGTCIPREQCPCQHRGREFSNGATITKGCNTCKCTGGIWECTKVQCGARCAAVGDPHYVTFDGRRYDFMGKCNYYLLWNSNFSIEAENVACAGAISEAMGFSAVTTGVPSCTKSLTIRTTNTTIKLKLNREVQVNGEEILQFPVLVADVSLRMVSSIFLVAEFKNGIEVWWDSMTRAYIDVPAHFHSQTAGLCGTFNENQFDDFITPQGDIEQSVVAFANKWKTVATCDNVVDKQVSHPCDENMQNKAVAEAHCKKLKSKLFAGCNWMVDVEPFYQDCLYDMCSCQGKIGACMCPIFSAYAKECVSNGVHIDWRREIRECGVHCPGSQRYQVCGDSCTRSCRDISYNPRCRTQCVEGCNCPPGQTLNKQGVCIAIAECPCLYNEIEYPAGHKEIRDGAAGLELCLCSGAQWNCQPASPEEIKQYPPRESLVVKCSAAKNFESTDCEPIDPTTCNNMHLPETAYATSPATCQPGCKCKKGYVLDTVTKECILPSKCPCHHGGRSYREGETTQEYCNVCTCTQGLWDCTSRLCSGTCTTWGASHFKTFDGKIYDFEGSCDYMLTHGKTSRTDSFEVSIQNMQCGSSGVTCAKSVTIKVGSDNETETVVLTKDKPVPSFLGFTRTTVRQAGLFVFVEVTDLGLVVQWDRGTRIIVTIKPEWSGRLKGLCGNYNDNQLDDFQTPSGGVSEVSAKLFGDSWRMQDYCPESSDIVDTCEIHPTRKTWAMQKCGILKSNVFKYCHSEVPVGPYIERCLIDTCGCDLGGDCECLCTAIAAYAQECNLNGVPIKWRSQELCPIQCDESCSNYSPCVATCPKETCENRFMYKSLTQLCVEETCVEGCQLKPCPPGEIYNNLNDLKCVPENKCERTKCIINGKTYFEGDLIKRDDCHSCHCSQQKEVCHGEPCTSTATTTSVTTPITITTEPMSDEKKCKSGWSSWISNDKPDKQKKPNDEEPLVIEETKSGTMKHTFPCSRSEMVDTMCRTVGTHTTFKETGQDVECSLERGLKCSGTANNPCLDYEITVLCKCENEPTTKATTPTTVTEPTTTEFTRPPTAPPVTCEPGWTEWMDSSRPDRNGEFETTDLLRQSFSFCPDHMIEETQCRTVNSHEDSRTNDPLSMCDRRGLRCSNKGRGDMMCQNYEVRYKCNCECLSGLGMENGDIEDSQISVSSFTSPSTLGNHARLNGPGAWVPQSQTPKHWIQVSFNEPKNLTGIDIQGHPHREAWVEAFTVSVSNDGNTWTDIFEKDSNWPKKFKGNSDQNTKVRALFPESVLAQYIRIYPTFNHNFPAMRFEVLGCDIIGTTTQATTTLIPRIIPPTPCVENAWTPWMNSNKPGPGNWDESEDYDSLRAVYGFCDSANIKKIRCRTADKHASPQEAGQHGVTCNLNTGLHCSDRLQAPNHCLDYEVSFYCQCEEVDLCQEGQKVWEHESDCHKYHECVKATGESAEKSCGLYMLFNPNTLKCDWPDDVIKVKPECAGTTVPPPTTKRSRCDTTGVYTIAHETDCDKYYYCDNGDDVLTVCDPDLIYSEPLMGCDDPYTAIPVLPGCKGVTPQVTSEVPPSTPSSPCDPKMLGVHRVPHETACDQYYHCEPDGSYELRTCEDGMIYSVSITACDLPEDAEPAHANCIASTTAPPEFMTNCTEGWTKWFNSNHPDAEFSAGDFELIEDLQESGELNCDIRRIECKYYGDADTTEVGLKTKKSGTSKVLKDAKESGERITCNKKIGLLCSNAEQLNAICSDYAIRVYCRCGGPIVTTRRTTPTVIYTKETTEVPETTELTNITPMRETTKSTCKHGWTDWFNSSHPDAEFSTGDFELVEDRAHNCEAKHIKRIECKYYATSDDGGIELKDAKDSGDIFTCSRKLGLLCSNAEQLNSVCHDYAMRFYCQCGGGSRLKSKKIGSIGMMLPRTTTTITTITHEKLTETTIEETMPTIPPTKPTRPTAPTAPTIPTTVPTTEVTEKTCVPGWTEWFNTTHPEDEFSAGDFELIDDIRDEGGNICAQKFIKNIECKYYADGETSGEGTKTKKGGSTRRQLKDYLESGERVTCKKTQGLICNNQEQLFSMCQDYAMRVFCECEPARTTPTKATTPSTTVKVTTLSTTVKVTTPSTTVTEEIKTTSECPPGQVWKECAIPCEHVCHFYQYELRLQGFCDAIEDCRAGCIDEQISEDCSKIGFKYRANNKCVREYDCPCASGDGTIIPPGEVITENGCERCQCLNNRYTCDKTPCETTEVTEPTTPVVIYETMRTKPTPPSENHTKCDNGWTRWKFHPRENENDDEIQSLSYLHGDCKPVNIECRSRNDQRDWRETGQAVTCDTENGLRCYQDQNLPDGCLDYEIRVNCFCYATSPVVTETTATVFETESSEVTSPTPSTPIVITTTAVPCDGWSQWFNDGNPDTDGQDREGKLTLELTREDFCQHGEIADIECVDAETERNYLESDDVEVTCKLDDGLICRNAEQEQGRQCKDYKIRYYCSCESVTTTSTHITVQTTLSPPPQCDENNFIKLVNGPIPLPDTAFKASTSLNADFAPHNAKIVDTVKKSNRLPSWIAGQDDTQQFLQVDLGHVEPTYGVIVQGHAVSDKRVTSYNVEYSRDGITYSYATDLNYVPQVFRGPVSSSSGVKQIFEIPFETRYIRFKPLTWQNGIAMSVEIFGCEQISTVSEYTPTSTTFITSSSDVIVLCDDEMGLENGFLDDQQIEVSSVLDDNKDANGPKNIRLNGNSAWRPDVFGNQQYVLIDFMGPRNLSGIVTQGDEVKGTWIESYTVQYSNDKENWNPILDDNMNEQEFLGNFDSSTPYQNLFKRMIHAQYLKIIPKKWYKKIGLRMEVIGCFHPYPTLPPVFTTTQFNEPYYCSCPNLPEEMKTECNCESNKLWNGKECVHRANCGCYVGHNLYAVGAVFEKEDCQKCVCSLSGHAECRKHECKNCGEGLQCVLTALCGCVGKPCPENTRLCPTSNVCVNVSQWCDGVQDCPDDETGCTTPSTPSTPTPAPPCPTVPTCPEGYTLVEKKKAAQTSAAIVNTKKTGVKVTKGGRRPPPERLQQECPEYECKILPPPPTPATTPCPPPNCPPGYDAIKLNVGTVCPKYRCDLPPKEEKCRVDEKNFKTFDNTFYQYVICNHILAQDKDNEAWKISVEKICAEDNICRKHLTIKQDEHVVKIRADFAIEYDGYTFTIEQAQSIGSSHQEFLISRLGNSVLFESNHYGFRVTVDQKGTIEVAVPSKLKGQVNGLCGLYDGQQENDKSKPNGVVAQGSQEFGDSWALPGTEENCVETTCAVEFQTKALAICTAVSEKNPLNQCKDVVAMDQFVSSCMDRVCKCLEQKTNEDECRCDATLDFMVECQTKSPDLDLNSWRIEYNCAPNCPPGEVYKDCYKHKCERTCENLQKKIDPCPVMEDSCFPGCYCPDGFVRKGEKCIKAVDCKDCVCNGYGDPHYITFDRQNVTFNGNCTYVASRDIARNGKHVYQVLATNVECVEEPGTTCTYAITVLYKDHVIYIRRVEGQKKILTDLDGVPVTTFPHTNDWLRLESFPGKSVTVHIAAIHLEVTYMYYNYAFEVRLPSKVYAGNKTEGLCANCNKEKKDDLRTKDDVLTDDVNVFGMSWLVTKLPPGLPNEENCQPLVEKPPCKPLPPSQDPCLWIMDEAKFGKCHALVSPESYLVACQYDICNSINRETSACRDMQAYAQECEEHGVCLDWRANGTCTFECAEGMEYKACSCPKTCDNYEELAQDPKQCEEIRSEGCVCKDNKVLDKHGKCVREEQCKPCDDEGHVVGETWHPNNCTTCKCGAPRKAGSTADVRCTETTCPAKEICKNRYTSKLVKGTENDCCPKYECVFDGCPEKNPIVCGPNQVIKDISTDECPTLICQCIPADECPSVDANTNVDLEPDAVYHHDLGPGLDFDPFGDAASSEDDGLEPGMVAEVNNTGCCPHITHVCKPEGCPKIKCAEFHVLEVVPGTEQLCCPKQNCVPPKDACLFYHLFIAEKTGGARLRTVEEKLTEVRQIGTSWNDGPCNKCTCIAAAKTGDAPSVTCSSQQCSTEDQHPDFADYVLESHIEVGECCARFRRKACKVDGGEYAVGEEWPVLNDKCSVQSCVQDGKTIKKETKTEKCITVCEPGLEYEVPPEDSDKCCGQCKQVACVVDGKVHAAGSNWYSADRCTHFFCDKNQNGTLQVDGVTTSCPNIAEEELEHYVITSHSVEGECCNKTQRVACVDNGRQYEIGQEWLSSDGNKCKKFLCARNDKDEIVKQERVEICDKHCDEGSVYVEAPADSDKCCGGCRPEYCVVEGQLKKQGETWQSNDKCTTFECTILNNQVMLSNSTKMCTALPENCKPGTIKLSPDGCCQTCDSTPGNLVNCEAKEVGHRTVGLVKEIHDDARGHCTNPQDIPNYKECIGFCESATKYSPLLSSQVSDCKCCQAEQFEHLSVELVCQDNTKYSKKIQVPKKCNCNACVAETTPARTKTAVKNPIKRNTLTDIFSDN